MLYQLSHRALRLCVSVTKYFMSPHLGYFANSVDPDQPASLLCVIMYMLCCMINLTMRVTCINSFLAIASRIFCRLMILMQMQAAEAWSVSPEHSLLIHTNNL